MAIEYRMIIKQNGVEKEYLGKVDTYSELHQKINELNQTLINGLEATVTLSYIYQTEEQKIAKRNRMRKVVEEEFAKMKESGEI